MCYTVKKFKDAKMLLFYLSLIEAEADKAKITTIYEKYLDWMLKIAFYHLENELDAEDVVNDVFLSIISSNCSIPLDNESGTKAYLFICIRNEAAKLRKSRKKHRTVDYDELFNISSKHNLEDEIIKRDTKEMLLAFIDTMSPIYKDVLTMKLSFEKSIKEISDTLKLPIKTVETRLSPGRAILKERFGDIEI